MSLNPQRLDNRAIDFFQRARWFQQKGSKIESIDVVDQLDVGEGLLFAICKVRFSDIDPELYLTLLDKKDLAVKEIDETGFLDFFFKNVRDSFVMPTQNGSISFAKFGDWDSSGRSTFELFPVVSSNTLVIQKEEGVSRNIVKFVRRLQAGENVESEINRHIFSCGGFSSAPAYRASAVYRAADGSDYHFASVFDYVDNDGSAWDSTLLWLRRSIGCEISGGSGEGISVDDYAAWAAKLGSALASLHLALARDGDGRFGIRKIDKDDVKVWRANWIAQFDRTFSNMKRSPVENAELKRVLSMEKEIRKVFEGSDEVFLKLGAKIRQHGDFHLGQVLVKDSDFYIIDFEGEPLKAYSERAIHYPALKDVAGVVRSFNYAAFAAYFEASKGISDKASRDKILASCIGWERRAREAFLKGYFSKLADEHAEFLPLADKPTIEDALRVLVMDKALYEVQYEINNRPDWLGIPLGGILNLMEKKR